MSSSALPTFKPYESPLPPPGRRSLSAFLKGEPKGPALSVDPEVVDQIAAEVARAIEIEHDPSFDERGEVYQDLNGTTTRHNERTFSDAVTTERDNPKRREYGLEHTRVEKEHGAGQVQAYVRFEVMSGMSSAALRQDCATVLNRNTKRHGVYEFGAYQSKRGKERGGGLAEHIFLPNEVEIQDGDTVEVLIKYERGEIYRVVTLYSNPGKGGVFAAQETELKAKYSDSKVESQRAFTRE